MKKLLMLLIAAKLLIACAFAEGTEPIPHVSGDWKYVLLEDGTAEIEDYSGTMTELTVPDQIDGIMVTSIGDKAFSHCSTLTSIVIPDSVTSIGVNPFSFCSELTDIIVSPENPGLATIDGVLFDKTDKRLICYPCAFTSKFYEVPRGVNVIGDSAFAGCDSLTTIVLPNTVHIIGEDAFGSCSSLTDITLPGSLMGIGRDAFVNCSALASITLPEGLQYISDRAFGFCNSLTSVTLPDSLRYVGENPFAGCDRLTRIIVSPEHPVLESIDGVLFDKTEKLLLCYPGGRMFDSYAVPQGTRTIGRVAFYGCNFLEKITLPNSLTSIEAYAFYLCGNLTSITIPASVTDIGYNAFYQCNDLTLAIPRDTWLTQWCQEKGMRYTYTDSLDWLLD